MQVTATCVHERIRMQGLLMLLHGRLSKLCSSGPHRGMAQMRKLACDGIRTNSRGEPAVPLVSARQEILTSLVSALDSVVRPKAGITHVNVVLDVSACGVKTNNCKTHLNKQRHWFLNL